MEKITKTRSFVICTLPNRRIIRVIKSRRMMDGACATYADSILVEKLSDTDHLEDLGLGGKIVL